MAKRSLAWSTAEVWLLTDTAGRRGEGVQGIVCMFPGPFQLQPIMEVEGMAHGGPVFRNSSFQKVGKWRAVISLFLLFGCFFFFFFLKILKPVVGVRSGERPVRVGAPAAWCHGISLHPS